MKNNWPEVPLGEVLARSSEWVPIDPQETYREVTVRLWGKGVTLRRECLGSEIKSDRRLRVRPNQFIASRIDARNGAFGLIPDSLDGAVVTNDFPVFTPNPKRLLPKYLGWMSRTRSFVEMCTAASEGTTNRVRLKEERFLTMPIALPPLSEQQRIVARIESLAAKIAEAAATRAELIDLSDLSWFAIAREIRHCLATSATTRRLGDVTTVTAGGTPSRENPTYWNGNVPWIKTGELCDNTLLEAEEHITDDAVNNSSAKLFPPDTILIALYGQGQTRGRTARLGISATTNQACAAILPCAALDPAYLQYWLRSLYREMRETNHGGAQPNWNGQMIKSIKIAVPPLAEQRRIVAHLDAVTAKTAAIKQLQEQSAAELEALLPSILDRAFKGEL